MLSGKLLPAHPKPLLNEVLSSWFARVAEANAVKQHSLAFMRMGIKKPPWSWGLDLESEQSFLQNLCKTTGTTFENGKKTTLADYSGIVFPQRQRGKRTRWVLPTKDPTTKRLADGIQFCPTCLSEGAFPYYRRQWRLAFFTFCPVHMNLLYDACPSCEAPVAYHRHDCSIGIESAGSIANCYNCGVSFLSSPPLPPEKHQLELLEHYRNILMEFQTNRPTRYDLAFFTVLHQLCKVMVSKRNQGKLREHIYSHSKILPRPISFRNTPFYWRRRTTRHHVISLALWLLLDPVARITNAWRAGAVRYSSLVKDFPEAPKWYSNFTQKLNRQKTKLRCIEKCNFENRTNDTSR